MCLAQGQIYAKSMAFCVRIGCVRFARHCGKTYSRHLFPYGGLGLIHHYATKVIKYEPSVSGYCVWVGKGSESKLSITTPCCHRTLASLQCRRPYYLSRNPFLGGMRHEPKRCLRWRLAALIVSG